MTSKDLHALDDKALVHREMALEREMLALTFRLRTGQLEDSSKLGRVRRDIARVRTAQRERELAAGKGKNSLRDAHRSSFVASAGSDSAAPETKSGGFIKGLVDKIGGVA
jgi:large subunit ribosomal protein L29